MSLFANGDILIRFPEEKLFIFASEGTGDNLLREDIEDGYVDYVNWTSYRLDLDAGEPLFSEKDGGMMMSKKYICDMSDLEILDSLRHEAGIGSGKYEIM